MTGQASRSPKHQGNHESCHTVHRDVILSSQEWRQQKRARGRSGRPKLTFIQHSTVSAEVVPVQSSGLVRRDSKSRSALRARLNLSASHKSCMTVMENLPCPSSRERAHGKVICNSSFHLPFPETLNAMLQKSQQRDRHRFPGPRTNTAFIFKSSKVHDDSLPFIFLSVRLSLCCSACRLFSYRSRFPFPPHHIVSVES